MECPICDYHIEDDWRFVVDCSASVEAITDAGLDSLLSGRVRHMRTAADLILDICQVEDREVAGRFAMVAWTLWNNRNNKVWNGELDGGRWVGERSHVRSFIKERSHSKLKIKKKIGLRPCVD
jgi:hypothetical protein